MSLEALTDMLLGQDMLEWLGLITGICYVVYAAYARPVAWLFGMVSSACLAWKSFYDYKLIADGILQVFYIGMSVAGLLAWQSGQGSSTVRPIRTFPGFVHLAGIGACLVMGFPLSELLIRWAGARYGYLDTVLMMMSLWATALLVRKDLHQWLYWIVIDAVYVWLYWQSRAWLFLVLFLVYGFVAIWGWQRWSAEYHARSGTTTNH